jgi:succinate dehydrogenase/fumarate reductase flavoprotein subunit
VPPVGEGFDSETDVLVIGYGFAGGAAAIAATDAGSAVTIVEKMPQGGGNSRFSYGGTFVARQSERSVADLVSWLDAMCMGTTPTDVLEAFVRGTQSLPAWVASLGGEFTSQAASPVLDTFPRALPGPNFPRLAPTQEMFDKLWAGDVPGLAPSQRLWDLISAAVAAQGVQVLLGASATDLVTDGTGAVLGAVIEVDGERRRIRARRGVILSCGGFANNPAMKKQFLPSSQMRFAGSPGNTGDGVGMAMRAGADLWHMTRTSTFIGFQAPEFEAGFCVFFHGPGFVWLDRRGRRYIDETSVELHDFERVFSELDPDTLEFVRYPTWGVFDRATLLGGPMTWPVAGYNRDTYTWSPDNSAEVERGWIVEAGTVAELAERTGMPADALAETLAQYHDSCTRGHDADFGRRAETLSALEPPYYAIRLEPVALNTQGGARRDARARVLDTRGRPIPGLWSAGEFGSIWGHLYPGGGNITEALVFGRLAGRGAAGRDLAEEAPSEDPSSASSTPAGTAWRAGGSHHDSWRQ